MQAFPFSQVLQLDIQGTPQAWITLEQAATYVASGAVAWTEGCGPLAVLRGGFNVPLGRDSQIEVPPIVALAGSARVNLFDVVPTVSKPKLLRRDRHTCAYCGQVCAERDLQCEHVVPASRGGAWAWMNPGPVNAIFRRALRVKKATRQGASRSQGRHLGKGGNAGDGLFDRNPEGTCLKTRHSLLCSLPRHPVWAASHA